MGATLAGKFDVQTDLRMLVISPSLILYKIDGDRIIITRVLDGRSDYLAELGLIENEEAT